VVAILEGLAAPEDRWPTKDVRGWKQHSLACHQALKYRRAMAALDGGPPPGVNPRAWAAAKEALVIQADEYEAAAQRWQDSQESVTREE